jgi:predicted dehydrogenase
MNLSPEEIQVGKENYYNALSVSRRDFLKGVVAAGAVSTGGLGAMYFGYQEVGNPVRVGVIGTGDEGNILIGALNPKYVQVTAIADIRPSSIHRAFHGDWSGAVPAATHALRPGLIEKYGWSSDDEARKKVKVYDGITTGGWEELLKDPDIEGVIIALPLHLHAKVAVAAMLAGKHVLTEKLMAHNVGQCKAMCRVAEETDLLLATGHQRHYSILYDNAVNLIRWGALGQIHHIRAQWHRGNLPGQDSWAMPVPGGEFSKRDGKKIDKIAGQLKKLQEAYAKERDPAKVSLLEKQVAQWTAWDADKTVDAKAHQYEDLELGGGYLRTALEELVRWRLWNRTGGGLMAELGSHQLDAASIFCTALRNDGKKAHPLNVHAVGGRHVFPYDRDADDHVYCMYEFPGPAYEFPDGDPKRHVGYYDPVMNYPDPKSGIPRFDEKENPNNKIVVTYSSINGSGFGGYGEVVMGTKGELALLKEQEVMLYRQSDTAASISVKDAAGAALDTQASGGPPIARATETETVSRGYTEEIEHWAWCIRNRDPENKPRCHPPVALGDAVIALTTRVAMARGEAGEGGYIRFKEEWYDYKSPETPDGSDVEAQYKELTKKA